MIRLLDLDATPCQKSDATENEWLLQTAVIIPARNEEKSLGLVLGDLPKVGKVFVVDNGSTDMTSHVAQANGAFIVDEEVPGYGRACRAGIHALRRYNRQLKSKPDATGDAASNRLCCLPGCRLQRSSRIVTQLIEPLASGTADFVLGSRLLGSERKGRCPCRAFGAIVWPAS